ncbi:hypothetical protein [Maricaulis sp.]|uniref:hypothetical protein n=1 Tax=Maricaulis sp. TaxID=1486257 RepID=UPI0025B99C1F|nr:hypothetical protein [Maricaulis sp.]
MTVRVDLIDGGTVVEIRARGQATRREAGWATERARELCQRRAVTAILADCSEAERQTTPQLSAEIIENFLFAIERPVAAAYVVPRVWDDAYHAAVRSEIGDLPEHARFFTSRDTALDWLVSLQPA